MPDKVATNGVLNSARLHNDFVDASNHYKERQRLGVPAPIQRSPISTDVVKVRNETGGDLARGAVVDLGSYLLTIDTDTRADAENLWFQGTTPALGGCYGVVRQALPDDDIGECQMSGFCVARVNFSDIAHKWARPKVGQTYFESATSGPVEIACKHETGTGVQETMVILRYMRPYYAAKNGGTPIAARSGTTCGSGTVTLRRAPDNVVVIETR